jgi:uncharacterized Zn finger protein
VSDYSSLLIDVEIYCKEHIIGRGIDYFNKQTVRKVEFSGHYIHANVSGSYASNYKVIVDAEDFTNSICSCPYDDYCKHIITVIYTVQNYPQVEKEMDSEANIEQVELEELLLTQDKEYLIQLIYELVRNDDQKLQLLQRLHRNNK